MCLTNYIFYSVMIIKCLIINDELFRLMIIMLIKMMVIQLNKN